MAFSMMLYGQEGMVNGDYWITTLGDYGSNENGYSVAIDSSNNVYVTGSTNTSAGAGSIDLLLSKYDSAGTIQWQRIFGEYFTERAIEVAIDSSDNIYVTGYTYSVGSGSFRDILLVKYDSAGNLQWQRVIGGDGNDYSMSVAIDSSNNVYVTGYTFLEDSWNCLLVRYNSSGTIQWQRTLTGTGNDNAFAMSVSIDSSDNIYMVGLTESTVDGSNYDSLIAKYNSSGTIQWQRVIGGDGNDYGRSVAIDSSDNVYMFGYTQSTVDANNDFCVAKYNSSGTIQWQQTLGGTGDETGWSVAIDSSDNVYVTGSTESTVDGSSDFLIAKYNSSGVIQWQRTLGWTGDAFGRSVAIDSNDNVYVLGYTESTVVNNSDIFLAKLPNDGSLTGTYSMGDASYTYAETFLETKISTFTSAESTLGSIYLSLDSKASSFTSANPSLTSSFVKLIKPPIEYWVSILGGGDNTGYITRTMAIDSANNIYVGGYNLSDPVNGPNLLLIKRDPLGAVIWQRILTGAQDDVGFAVVVDLADNVYISGYTISGGAGSLDFIVVKYNPSGEVIWQKFLGGPSVDIGYSLAVDSANNLIVAGQGFTGLGNYDYSVSKLDSSGNQIWQAVIGGTEADTVRGVALDSEDSIYVFGYSASEPAQNANMLLVKYNSAGDIQWGRLLGGYNFEQGNAIAIDASDDIFIVGGSASTGAGGYDMITAKLDKSGNIYWQRALGGAANDMGQSIAIDSLGNVYVCGWTQSQGTGPVTMIIARYDTFGNLVFQRVLYGVGTEYSYDIAIDSNDDMLITGATNSVTLDASESITIRLPNNGALTGQININGATFTYEAGELTPSVATLNFEFSTLTLGTAAFTSSDSNLTSSIPTIGDDVVQL